MTTRDQISTQATSSDGDRIGRAVRAFVLLGLALALPFATADAASEDTEPTRIKGKRSSLRRATYSAVAVDAASSPHVVYVSRSKSSSSLRRIWYEGRRRREEVIVKGSEHLAWPAIAVDAAGGLHVTYRKSDPGGAPSLHYATLGPAGWETEELEPGGSAASVAIDEDGIVHVIHIDGGLRHLQLGPEGWEAETVHPGGTYLLETSLLAHDGELHATFTEANAFLAHAWRDVHGAWHHEVLDPGDEGHASGGHAAIDAQGRLNVVWKSGVATRLGVLDEGEWMVTELTSRWSLFGQALPKGVASRGNDPNLLVGPDGCLTVVTSLILTKGNLYGDAIAIAKSDGTSWALVGFSAGSEDVEAAMGADGLLHYVSAESGAHHPRGKLFSEKGAPVRIAVKAKGSGTVTLASTGFSTDRKGVARVARGLEISLVAEAAEGYQFKEWLRDGEGDDPELTLTVGKRNRVLAAFE